MNSYDLSRKWFDWCFENPEKINTNHTALYFFCIEHCNRLGWKKKFGLPTTMAKEAIGIRSYNTYIKTLKDLIDFGFIEMIERSKNQYSCNIVALSNFNKAHSKALDKAMIKHVTKQGESISSINKQETNKQETINKFIIPTILEISEYCKERKNKVDAEKFYNFYTSKGWMVGKNKMKDWQAAVRNWEKDYKQEKTLGM